MLERMGSGRREERTRCKSKCIIINEFHLVIWSILVLASKLQSACNALQKLLTVIYHSVL